MWVLIYLQVPSKQQVHDMRVWVSRGNWPARVWVWPLTPGGPPGGPPVVYTILVALHWFVGEISDTLELQSSWSLYLRAEHGSTYGWSGSEPIGNALSNSLTWICADHDLFWSGSVMTWTCRSDCRYTHRSWRFWVLFLPFGGELCTLHLHNTWPVGHQHA